MFVHGDFLKVFLEVGGLFLIGVIAPAADFAMLVKNSLNNTLKVSMYCVLGLTIGAFTTTLFCALGIQTVEHVFPHFSTYLKVLGGCYLIYIGITSFISLKKKKDKMSPHKHTPLSALTEGFMTTTLNPHDLFFILTTLSLIPAHYTTMQQTIFWAEIVVITFVWYTFIAFCFTHKKTLKWLENKKKYITWATGSVLLFIGGSILCVTIFKTCLC